MRSQKFKDPEDRLLEIITYDNGNNDFDSMGPWHNI